MIAQITTAKLFSNILIHLGKVDGNLKVAEAAAAFLELEGNDAQIEAAGLMSRLVNEMEKAVAYYEDGARHLSIVKQYAGFANYSYSFQSIAAYKASALKPENIVRLTEVDFFLSQKGEFFEIVPDLDWNLELLDQIEASLVKAGVAPGVLARAQGYISRIRAIMVRPYAFSADDAQRTIEGLAGAGAGIIADAESNEETVSLGKRLFGYAMNGLTLISKFRKGAQDVRGVIAENPEVIELINDTFDKGSV